MASQAGSLPPTMRAVVQPSRDSHHLVMTEIPVPIPSHPGELLVKVHATSPCAGELDWAKYFPELFLAKEHDVPGQDIVGDVLSSSLDTSSSPSFRPGDRVYARIDATRPGGAAEYVVARASELAHCPTGLSTAEAAATPLSALTAYQALFVHGTLDPEGLPLLPGGEGKGDEDVNGSMASKREEEARARNAHVRVLVTAASGGVGTWAVQLARAAGAQAVIGVCGPSNVETVRGLGATEVVDYRTQSVEAWALGAEAKNNGERRACDLVIDCVGGETLSQCWDAVEEGGVLISICSDPEQARGGPAQNHQSKTQVRSKFFIVEPLGRDLETITGLIEAGACRPVVDSVVGFSDFAQAWEKVEAGHSRGKVIVMIGDDAQGSV